MAAFDLTCDSISCLSSCVVEGFLKCTYIIRAVKQCVMHSAYIVSSPKSRKKLVPLNLYGFFYAGRMIYFIYLFPLLLLFLSSAPLAHILHYD